MDEFSLMNYNDELIKVFKSQPSNKCSFCKTKKMKSISFIYNDRKKNVEAIIECKCLEEKKIVQINDLFLIGKTEISNNQLISNTNLTISQSEKLFNQVSDLLKKNYLFVREFLKIINHSGYHQKYKKLFFEKMFSSYNANLKINIDCYKILHFLNYNDNLLNQNQVTSPVKYNLNYSFGLKTSFYPIEDTVDIAESYLKYNFIIDLDVEHHYSTNNSIVIKDSKICLTLFDGRIILCKQKNKFQVVKFDYTKKNLVVEFEEEIDGHEVFSCFFQLPNGVVCNCLNKMMYLYNETTFTVIGSFHNTLSKISNYSNGLIGLELNEIIEIWKTSNVDGAIQYITEINANDFILDTKEIQKNKILIIGTKITIYNTSTLQIETVIVIPQEELDDMNPDDETEGYYMDSFKLLCYTFVNPNSSQFIYKYSFSDGKKIFVFDLHGAFRSLELLNIKEFRGHPLPLHDGRLIIPYDKKIFVFDDVTGTTIPICIEKNRNIYIKNYRISCDGKYLIPLSQSFELVNWKNKNNVKKEEIVINNDIYQLSVDKNEFIVLTTKKKQILYY